MWHSATLGVSPQFRHLTLHVVPQTPVMNRSGTFLDASRFGTESGGLSDSGSSSVVAEISRSRFDAVSSYSIVP